MITLIRKWLAEHRAYRNEVRRLKHALKNYSHETDLIQ